MSASTPETQAFALFQAGRLAEAEGAWRAILARRPSDAQAQHVLGLILARTGRMDEGMALLERSIAAAPRDPGFRNNRALLLSEQGRLEEAERDVRRALTLEPRFPAGLRLLSLVLRLQGDRAVLDRGELEAAAALYDRALAADPAAFDAMNNRGNVALALGDLEGAERFYRNAEALRPDLADPRFSLAQLALFRRDFAAGWEGYELRFDTHPPMAERRMPALPALTRSRLGQGLRVAVWSEQGVGDQILFSTLLPELVRAGARPVAEIDPRLLGLYARCVPGVEFVAAGSAHEAFAACDAQVALGSLARLFRRDAASFARQPKALLAADPARVAAVRGQLGPGRWIAVSWRSLQARERRYLERRKSVPLETLARLAEMTGTRLLDVQYGNVDAERAAFVERHPGVLTRLGDLDTLDDFEGLVAALQACEALVSVSNATAHLAGAIGRRTLLLYPGAHPPFHYWVPGPDGRSPWYGCVEIVTDAAHDRWPEIVEAAAARFARS